MGLRPGRDRQADAEGGRRLVRGPPFAREVRGRAGGTRLRIAPDIVSLGVTDSSWRRRAEVSVPGCRRAGRQGAGGNQKDESTERSRRASPGHDTIPPGYLGLHGGKSTGAPGDPGEHPAKKSRSEPFGRHRGCQIIATTAARKHSEIADAPRCTTPQASRNSTSPGSGRSPQSGAAASHVWIFLSAGQHRPVAIAAAKTQQPSPIHGQGCEAAERSPAHSTIAPRTGVKSRDRSAQFVLGWKYRRSPGSWRGSAAERARAAYVPETPTAPNPTTAPSA